MKKTINNIDEYIVVSYFIPFISCDSMVMMISGVSTWGPYNILVKGLQTRILGLLIFIFVAYIFYIILNKWPKSLGGNTLKVVVLKIFLKSPFLYFWILSAVILVISEFDKLKYLRYIYFLIIILVAYFQYVLINKIINIIKYYKDLDNK